MSSSRTLPELTSSGLPLDHTQSATRTTDKGGDGGVARRIDCGSLPSATLLQKTPTNNLNLKRRSSPAAEGAAQDENVKPRRRRSLVDDDDDEIVDYFHKTSYDNNTSSETSAAPTTTSTDTPSPFWPVTVSTIPSLPSLNYPLEKTSVHIPSQQILSPSIISQRIVSILQQRSISATYDTSNAKVDCITKTNVEFRIRLYNNNKGRTITTGDNNNNQHGIIVEIQRRNGFNLSYMKDVHAILDAAVGGKKKGEEVDEGENVNVLRSYWETIEEGKDSCDMSSSNSEEEDMVRGCTSLRIISNMLCPQEVGGGNDQEVAVTVENQDLALDSLASLTSLENMGSKVAINVSNEFLTSETCADLRHVVFSNVGHPTRLPQDCTVQQTLSSTLQSLKVLANVSSNSSKLGKLLSQNEDEMLSKLIDNIENAKVNPQAADLSCVILKNIEGTAASSSSLPPQYKERLSKALMAAGRYGATCYADLEIHAQECMESISNRESY